MDGTTAPPATFDRRLPWILLLIGLIIALGLCGLQWLRPRGEARSQPAPHDQPQATAAHASDAPQPMVHPMQSGETPPESAVLTFVDAYTGERLSPSMMVLSQSGDLLPVVARADQSFLVQTRQSVRGLTVRADPGREHFGLVTRVTGSAEIPLLGKVTLMGRVEDERAQPVVGAQVDVDLPKRVRELYERFSVDLGLDRRAPGIRGVTDEAGEFEITDLPAQDVDYDLVITAEGFVQALLSAPSLRGLNDLGRVTLDRGCELEVYLPPEAGFAEARLDLYGMVEPPSYRQLTHQRIIQAGEVVRYQGLKNRRIHLAAYAATTPEVLFFAGYPTEVFLEQDHHRIELSFAHSPRLEVEVYDTDGTLAKNCKFLIASQVDRSSNTRGFIRLPEGRVLVHGLAPGLCQLQASLVDTEPAVAGSRQFSHDRMETLRMTKLDVELTTAPMSVRLDLQRVAPSATPPGSEPADQLHPTPHALTLLVTLATPLGPGGRCLLHAEGVGYVSATTAHDTSVEFNVQPFGKFLRVDYLEGSRVGRSREFTVDDDLTPVEVEVQLTSEASASVQGHFVPPAPERPHGVIWACVQHAVLPGEELVVAMARLGSDGHFQLNGLPPQPATYPLFWRMLNGTRMRIGSIQIQGPGPHQATHLALVR